MASPVITLMTDYGLDDEFVGVCRGVIAGICPQALVIDLTHGIPRHDVRTGALVLAQSLRYLPVGVHVGVVDPGVGAERLAVALALADGRMLVGPDNGLLWPAAEAGGGIVEAVEISHSPLRLEPVSATFHGRDLFAPVAARLAAGHPLPDAGTPLDPEELVRIEIPDPEPVDGGLRVTVTLRDRFGNLQLAAGHEHVEQAGLRLGHTVEVRHAGSALGERDGVTVARYVRTFAEGRADELLLYEDAGRRLALAVNHGNASDELGLGPGDELVLVAR